MVPDPPVLLEAAPLIDGGGGVIIEGGVIIKGEMKRD